LEGEWGSVPKKGNDDACNEMNKTSQFRNKGVATTNGEH